MIIRCYCDGRYPTCAHGSRCYQRAGGPWSPFFCPNCDSARMEEVGRSLRSLLEDYRKKDSNT